MLVKWLRSQLVALLIIFIIAITQSQCHLAGSDNVGRTAENKHQKRIIFPTRLIIGLIFVYLVFSNTHKPCFGKMYKRG